MSSAARTGQPQGRQRYDCFYKAYFQTDPTVSLEANIHPIICKLCMCLGVKEDTFFRLTSTYVPRTGVFSPSVLREQVISAAGLESDTLRLGTKVLEVKDTIVGEARPPACCQVRRAVQCIEGSPAALLGPMGYGLLAQTFDRGFRFRAPAGTVELFRRSHVPQERPIGLDLRDGQLFPTSVDPSIALDPLTLANNMFSSDEDAELGHDEQNTWIVMFHKESSGNNVQVARELWKLVEVLRPVVHVVRL